MDVRFDCRHYTGYKPCGKSVECKSKCAYYEPRGTRILILKLGAMGDVLRTTPLLTALRERYKPCHITWITDPESEPLLRYNPSIDRLLIWSTDHCLLLQAMEFDLLLNFEKELRALALDALIRAREKRGFALHPASTLTVHNPASEYALLLGIDDELKFRQNTKTMPQILFEMAELPYQGEEYILDPGPAAGVFAQQFAGLEHMAGTQPIIGINTGCGAIFPTKQWPLENFLDLIEQLRGGTDTRLLLLGGPREKEFNAAILENTAQGVLVDTGTRNSIEEFLGLLALCDIVVTADSFAMHAAIALKKTTIALLGPTSAAEIELFGRGELVVTGCSCAPCYRTTCDKSPSCMRTISPQSVFETVKRWLPG